MKKWLLILLMLTLVGCGQEEKTIIIAEQYGLAYAPIQVMKEKGFLDSKLADHTIEWVKFGNTTAIREAMVADRLDVGFLGIPPFIMGSDKGMDWRIFTGLSRAPLGLMGKESIESLKDIQADERIALPQPGSIQHILLSMAAERELNDATYFDDQLVTMKHPDGMQVLLTGNDIDYHFTSPPYLFEEKNQGMTEIISGETCFGDEFTFIVGITTPDFHEDEAAYQALNEALLETLEFMKESPEETLDILENYYDFDRETLETYVYDSGIVYETEVKGVETFVEFMFRNGYIEKQIEEDDLLW